MHNAQVELWQHGTLVRSSVSFAVESVSFARPSDMSRAYLPRGLVPIGEQTMLCNEIPVGKHGSFWKAWRVEVSY